MKFPSTLKRFLADERGVGSVFMIATLPIFLTLAGMAIDGAAAFGTRTELQAAADSAALASAQDLSAKGSAVAIQTAVTYAQKNMPVAKDGNVLATSDVETGNWDSTTRTFTANATPLNAVKVTMRRSTNNNNALPTTLLGLIGIPSWNIAAQSVVTTTSVKLRVSLALDNSGSMCEPDNIPCPGDTNPNTKINTLKTATTNLLTTLKGAASNPNDVTVAIVPFTNAVDVGTAYKNASWLTYAPWDAAGSGYGTYVNGQQTCTGSGRNRHCTTPQVWQPTDPTHASWDGCVMDRNQNYDVQNALPTAANVATLFPAAPASLYNTDWNSTAAYCPSKLIGATDVLDSNGWSNLTSSVSGMQAGGATNQPVGLAWAWMLMTSGSPIVDPGALPSDTQPVIILLSDGLNTQDRWTGDGGDQDSGTDARMAAICTNAKAAGVTIYTVFVDLNNTTGNSAPLQSCATDSSKYFHLTTANQIITTFNVIGHQITQLRVVN
jgi:Flp pilus assembly protein TadG